MLFPFDASFAQGVEIEPVSDDNFFEWMAKIQGLRETIWEGRFYQNRPTWLLLTVYYAQIIITFLLQILLHSKTLRLNKRTAFVFPVLIC